MKVGDHIEKKGYSWWNWKKKRYSVPCRGKIIEFVGRNGAMIETGFHNKLIRVKYRKWTKVVPTNRIGKMMARIKKLFKPKDK